MFVFAAAAPAFFVVVVGYVVGYAVAQWICSLLGVPGTQTPEVAGWATGLLLLAVVMRHLLGRWRRRVRKSGQETPHQK